MLPVPNHLIDGFPEVELEPIQAWWTSLTDPDRERIAFLCDERRESCLFGIVGGEMPEVEHGKFLPDAESLDQVGHWEQDRFDYLLNHPELVLVWDPSSARMHHICVAHPAARACWQSGSVPADFTCPFERGDCLMHPVRGRTLTFQGTQGAGTNAKR